MDKASDLQSEDCGLVCCREMAVKQTSVFGCIRLHSDRASRDTSCKGGEDTYSIVSEAVDQPTFAPAARRAGSSIKGCAFNLKAAGSAGLDWGPREDIADQIGHFIARSIAGGYRGQSGRDRNPHKCAITKVCIPHRFAYAAKRRFEFQ